MTHRYGVPFVLVFLAALPARISQQDWRVALRSYGPVRFGMTVGEASRVLGQELKADTTQSCIYVGPAAMQRPVVSAFNSWPKNREDSPNGIPNPKRPK